MEKKKNGKSKNKGGRPLFDGKDEKMVIAKLEEAAALDASVGEICLYADISADSYYRYLKKHPKFRERIEVLREDPFLKARQTIVKNLDNVSNSQWYLERKKKKEFSLRTEITGAEGADLVPLLRNDIRRNPSIKKSSVDGGENKGSAGRDISKQDD